MSRLDADDGELAARFRSLDEAARRRLACSMVRLALNECEPPVSLPPTAEQDSRERGFTALRLFVAEGQARARRFYEREGWHAVTEPYLDPIPGLPMVEYRRPLG